jgi:hypothetical protein
VQQLERVVLDETGAGMVLTVRPPTLGNPAPARVDQRGATGRRALIEREDEVRLDRFPPETASRGPSPRSLLRQRARELALSTARVLRALARSAHGDHHHELAEDRTVISPATAANTRSLSRVVCSPV